MAVTDMSADAGADAMMRERTALAMRFHDAYRQIVSSDADRERTSQAIAELSSAHYTGARSASPSARRPATSRRTTRTPSSRKARTPAKRAPPSSSAYSGMGLGYMEARDPETGVWWPASVVSQNLSGTFTVHVDGQQGGPGTDGAQQGPREMVVSPRNLRAGRRRTAVLLPKGASAWAAEGTPDNPQMRSVVCPDVSDRATEYVELYQPETSVNLGYPVRQTGRRAIRRPKYYTLERCYEELGRTKTECSVLEKENATLKGRVRSLEKQGAYQLEDLLGRAAPLMRIVFDATLTRGRPGIPPGKAKEVEEIYNTMLRAVDEDTAEGVRRYCLRGTKYDCFQALGALQHAGFPTNIVREGCDTDVAVHSGMRFEKVTPGNTSPPGNDNPRAKPGGVGFVTRVTATDQEKKTYDIHFPWGIMTGLSIEAGEVTPLQSPVLWCNAQRVCMPVVNNGHFAVLKADLDKARAASEELRKQLEVQRSGQAHSAYADEVKRISRHLEGTHSDAEKVIALQQRLEEMSRKLDDSDAEKRSLAQRLTDISGQRGAELERTQQQLREETTARLLAESHMQLEGQWGCVDPGAQVLEAEAGGEARPKHPRVFEILRNADNQMVFREAVAEGGELSGILHPCRRHESIPPALVGLAEYRAELSDGGVLWLGRTDKHKLVRAYRRSPTDRVEQVVVAVKVTSDSDAAKMPPYVAGACPRCAHKATPLPTPTVQKQDAPETPKGGPAADAAPEDQQETPEELEARIAELKRVLSAKDAELQELVRAYDALKAEKQSDSDTAAEVARLKADLQQAEERLAAAPAPAAAAAPDPDIRALRKEVRQLQDLLDAKDAELAELRGGGGGGGEDAPVAEGGGGGVSEEAAAEQRREVEALQGKLKEKDAKLAALVEEAARGSALGMQVEELQASLAAMRPKLQQAEAVAAEERKHAQQLEAGVAEEHRKLQQHKPLALLWKMTEEEEELAFDLFGEGDAVQNYKAAIGAEGVVDDPPMQQQPPPEAQAAAEPDAASAAAAADGTNPAAPTHPDTDNDLTNDVPHTDTTPQPQVSTGAPLDAEPRLAAGMVWLAGAAMCLTLPFPDAAMRSLRGLWLTRCGHAVRIAFNTDLRGEVVTMGTHTLPLLGAVAAPSHSCAMYATGAPSPRRQDPRSRLMEGDAVDVQMFDGSEEWVRGVVAEQPSQADSKRKGRDKGKLRVVTALSSPKKISKYHALRRSKGVWYMGARLLPISSVQYDLQWDDGDSWQRIVTRKVCVQCNGTLREVNGLPPPYGDSYWCSLCGEKHRLADGAFHCRTCNFDACRRCAKPLIYQHPPTPTRPAAAMLCSQCNEGPFTLDEVHAHWLYTCKFNSLRVPRDALQVKSRVNYSRRLRCAVEDGAKHDEEAAGGAEQGALADNPEGHGESEGEDDFENATSDMPPPEHTLHSYSFYTASEAEFDELFKGKLQGNTGHLNALGKIEVSRQRCGLQVVKRPTDRGDEKLCVILSTRGQAATPLCFACFGARVDAAKWLLRHGALPDMALRSTLSPLKLCRITGFTTFERLIQAAILARNPLAISFSDGYGDYTFSAPSDLLSNRMCNKRSERLQHWLDCPLPDGVMAKFVHAPSMHDPSSLGAAPEMNEAEAPLAEFIDGLTHDTPSGPFPGGVKKPALLALQKRVLRSPVVASLDFDLGSLSTVPPPFKVVPPGAGIRMP